MNHRRLLRSLFGLLCLLVIAVSASGATAAQPKRYNIISIVTDDQSRWSMGVYGNKESRTPNLDLLAKQSEQAVVQAQDAGRKYINVASRVLSGK